MSEQAVRRASLVTVVALGLLLPACGSSAPSGQERLPSGWTRYQDRERGYSVSYPRTWYRARKTLTPYLAAPREILALGTYPLHPGGERCAQFPVNALEDLGPTDAFLSVLEFSAPPNAPYRRRPAHFSLALGSASEAPDCLTGSVRFVDRFIPFRDGGRAYYAFVALGRSAPNETRRAVLDVLDSLRFDR